MQGLIQLTDANCSNLDIVTMLVLSSLLDVELDLTLESLEGIEFLFVSYLLLKYNFYIFAIDILIKIKYMNFYYIMSTYIQYAAIKFSL